MEIPQIVTTQLLVENFLIPLIRFILPWVLGLSAISFCWHLLLRVIKGKHKQPDTTTVKRRK